MEVGDSLRAFAELVDDVVFVTDLGVGMLWANTRLTERTGYRAEDFAFLPKENPFIHPEDVERVADFIGRFVASGERVSGAIENRFFTRWGEVITCRSQMIRIEWDGSPALLFVVGLAKPPPDTMSAQSFRRIVEEAHDGIVKLSIDGRVHYSNGRFHELVGKQPVDLAKLSFYDLVAADERDAVRSALARIAEAPGTFEAQLERPPRFVTISGSRLCGGDDDGLLLLLVRDVTEERRVASALQEAQKLESIGVLVGGVAHDFNNIATSMRASVSVASRLAPSSGRLAEVLRDLDAAGQRAADITSSLMAYAGKTPSRSERVELIDVVKKTTRFLRAFVSSSIRLAVVEPRESLAILGDSRQVAQVLVNLVTNGADAIDGDGGEIVIEVRARELTGGAGAGGERWLPSVPPAGRYVGVVVRDNGRGMAPDVLARFADLFFTTKERGHGLGLPATIGIVRLHRGAVRVSSALGRGSEVEALFPRIDRASSVAVARPPAQDHDERVEPGGTVLFVDDEPALRRLGGWILEDAGFEVVTMADGKSGLATFEASPSRFRVVVLDDRMPGMSGRKLLRHMRALREDLPVVLMSGFLESDLEEEHVFLQKPYDGESLERAVFEAIARRKRRA